MTREEQEEARYAALHRAELGGVPLLEGKGQSGSAAERQRTQFLLFLALILLLMAMGVIDPFLFFTNRG